MGKRILIADDEKEIVEILKLYLENEGYEIVETYDGIDALEKLQTNEVDLAVVDIMMPGMDGFNLTKRIREIKNIPVIILSARSEDKDKILGLGLGADDYIIKPFNPLEVVARVNAQLRRFYTLNRDPEKETQEDKLCVGPFTLNKRSCTFYKDETEIQLTSTEYKILMMLMEEPGRVFTKVQIYENVRGDYFDGDDNTIMVHISKIREKIEDEPGAPKYLKTIRGIGYRFDKRVSR
ncbi:MAG: response regulator transcription factor [Clostridiaceae bacterium]|nr:response regulator transcription factor [Clostridiaceae bacterium]